MRPNCPEALGLSPRAILALSSVGGLAFGLAAKNVIGNLGQLEVDYSMLWYIIVFVGIL